jgi:hypothetical protein
MALVFLGSSSFIVSNLWFKSITIVKSHLCPHYADDLHNRQSQGFGIGIVGFREQELLSPILEIKFQK